MKRLLISCFALVACACGSADSGVVELGPEVCWQVNINGQGKVFTDAGMATPNTRFCAPLGTLVMLSAEAATGWTFKQLSVDACGTTKVFKTPEIAFALGRGSCLGDRTISALFEPS